MRRILYVSLLLMPFMAANAQNQVKLDSLQRQLITAKEDSSKIKAMLEISMLYFNYNYPSAAEYAQKAMELARTKRLDDLAARADRTLARTFFGMGDYKNASTHFFDVLKYYEKKGDTADIIAMNNNLGAVYDRLHEYDKALQYFFKAQDLFNQQKNGRKKQDLMPTLYNNIANIYQTKGDFTSALQYYQKTLKLARELGDPYVQGMALNNLGKLYLSDLKDYNLALDYLQQGLKIRLELGDKSEISKSYYILADYYLRTKDLDKARTAVEESIKLGKEIGSLENQKAAYFILSDIESDLGNDKASLAAYKIFKEFNDSIQSQQANSEITRLQYQYDFEKAEQARDLEQRQTRVRYIITIIVLTAGLILAVLIAIIVRSRARQSELKRKNLLQDVEIKNKELTTNVMYLIRKNELINNVAERLLSLQTSVQPESHKIVQEIIIDLQKEGDNDSWKEFELRFNQVHSEFYKNLRARYPALSPADEKLCAFLRLNMSSKEIAAISQQSIKSVEVARARLRKKLNLTNTTSNLVTYLSNL